MKGLKDLLKVTIHFVSKFLFGDTGKYMHFTNKGTRDAQVTICIILFESITGIWVNKRNIKEGNKSPRQNISDLTINWVFYFSAIYSIQLYSSFVIYLVVQFYLWFNFFLNQYKISEPVQNFWISSECFKPVQIFEPVQTFLNWYRNVST